MHLSQSLPSWNTSPQPQVQTMMCPPIAVLQRLWQFYYRQHLLCSVCPLFYRLHPFSVQWMPPRVTSPLYPRTPLAHTQLTTHNSQLTTHTHTHTCPPFLFATPRPPWRPGQQVPRRERGRALHCAFALQRCKHSTVDDAVSPMLL